MGSVRMSRHRGRPGGAAACLVGGIPTSSQEELESVPSPSPSPSLKIPFIFIP